MKNALLLLMTPNMSLEKWKQLGYLSRELEYYKELCHKSELKLVIFSYGRNEAPYLKGYPEITILQMPGWIPLLLPFKLQNLIYHSVSLILFYKFFKQTAFAKTNQFTASPFGLVLKFFYRIPLIIRMGFYHSHFKKISRLQALTETLAFKFCNRILTTSTEAGIFIAKKYNVDRKKILSMCNSVDLELFKPLNVVKEYDLIFVGRLEEVKNIRLLLELISEMNLKTLIIGKGLLSEMVCQAKKQTNLITWLPGVENRDLPDYYNSSKCFLLLSQYEGNPKALLEAMACGIPGIGANVPGIRECIDNNNTGILLDVADLKLMRARIKSLIDDENRIKVLGEKALEWARINCDFRKNIQKEAQTYRTL